MSDEKMHIGINALYWRPDGMGGTQTYLLNLTRALVTARPEHHYSLFLNANGAQRFPVRAPNLEVARCKVPARPRAVSLLWENLALPAHCRRRGIDILHSLGYLAPIALTVPSVVTVLDMFHYVRPDEISRSKRLIWNALFPYSLRRADHIICISRSVERELVNVFPWTESKITPIVMGVDHSLFRPGTRPTREAPYVLAVASMAPHKNLARLVQAFSIARRVCRDLRLVLAGMKGPAYPSISAKVQELGVEESVEFTGRIGDEELVALYQGADALVFPTLYEGFGLPVLEAMACGCPVIASRVASLPEVAGEAALWVNPEDTDAIAEAILTVVGSESARQELSERGLAQAAQFSWERTAELTAGVYERCAGRRVGGR